MLLIPTINESGSAIFMARNGQEKSEIKNYIESQFGYDLNRTTADIRPDYSFSESCQGSVPESIISFLESTDYEHAVRNAVSLGGDADTMACIAGAIAQAYYGGVPEPIRKRTFEVLDERLTTTTNNFVARFVTGASSADNK